MAQMWQDIQYHSPSQSFYRVIYRSLLKKAFTFPNCPPPWIPIFHALKIMNGIKLQTLGKEF